MWSCIEKWSENGWRSQSNCQKGLVYLQGYQTCFGKKKMPFRLTGHTLLSSIPIRYTYQWTSHVCDFIYIRCSVLLEQNNKKIAISCQQTVTQSDFIPHFYFCFFFSGKLLLCWIGQLLYTIYIDNNNNNNTTWQIRSTHGVVSRKFHWGLFSQLRCCWEPTQQR